MINLIKTNNYIKIINQFNIDLNIDKNNFISYNDNIRDYTKFFSEDLNNIKYIVFSTIYGSGFAYFKNSKLHNINEFMFDNSRTILNYAFSDNQRFYLFINGIQLNRKQFKLEKQKYLRLEKLKNLNEKN